MSASQLVRNVDVEVHEINAEQVECIARAVKPRSPGEVGSLPFMWHWLALEKSIFLSSSGGGLLPELDGCVRVWSGGSVVNFESVRLDRPLRRVSSINSVREKTKPEGVRAYAGVKHDFYQDDRLIISEEQDIVYCESSLLSSQGISFAEDLNEVVALFRYIKSPFGTHGIQYDWRYLNGPSGVAGAVLHNSAAAVMMLREFDKHCPDSIIRSVGFTGVKPLPRMEDFYLPSRVLRKNVISA